MGLSLHDLVEIRDIKNDEIQGNQRATDEILVDELMVALGYDQKRKKSVRKVNQVDIDWLIGTDDDKRIAVKTLGYGYEIDTNTVDKVISYITNNEYQYGFITNGNDLVVVTRQVGYDNPIFETKILDDESKALDILNNFTSVEYDRDKIDEYAAKFQFNANKIKELALSKRDGIEALFIENIFQGTEFKRSERNEGRVKAFVTDIYSYINGEETERERELRSELDARHKETLEKHSKEVAELTEKLSDLEDNLKCTLDQLTQVTKDKEDLVTNKGNLESTINDLNEQLNSLLAQKQELEQNLSDTKAEMLLKVQEYEKKIQSVEERVTKEIEEGIKRVASRVDEATDTNTDTNTEEKATAPNPIIIATPEQTTQPQVKDTSTVDADVSDVNTESTSLPNVELGVIERDYTRLERELEESTSKIQELQKAIESLQQTNSSLTSQIDERNTIIDTLTQSIDGYKAEIDELKSSAVGKNKISLNKSSDTSEKSENNGESEESKSVNVQGSIELTGALTQGVSEDSSNTENTEEQLREEINSLKIENDSLREQVVTLTNEKSALEDRVTALLKTIDSLKEKLENSESKEVKEAKEILAEACLNESEDGERVYVCVINDNLYRETDLYKFAGRVLTEAYALVQLQLQPIIFDGDMFKFMKETERKDLIINNKFYDFDFQNETEDSVLNKLESVFRVLNTNIVYLQKVLGTKLTDEEFIERYTPKAKEDTQVSYPTTSTGMIIPFEILNSPDGTYMYSILEDGTQLYYDDNLMPYYINENNESVYFDLTPYQYLAEQQDATDQDAQVEQIEQVVESVETSEEDEEVIQENGEVDGLLRIAFNDYKFLLNYQYSAVNSLDYVIVNGVAHQVSSGNADGGLERVLQKIIDSIVLSYESFNSGVQILRKVNLPLLSSKFMLANRDNKNQLTKIQVSRYSAYGIESIMELCDILALILKEMDFNPKHILLVFSARYYKNDQVIIPSITKLSQLNIQSNEQFIASDDDNEFGCAVYGNITTSIQLTKSSLAIQEQIFKKIVKVSTDLFQIDLENEDDIAVVYQNMIESAASRGDFIDTKAVGKGLGSQYMILSYDEADVSPDHLMIETSDGTMYIQKFSTCLNIYALIKLNEVLNRTKKIKIDIMASGEAFLFYNSDFRSYDPTIETVVKGLTSYIDNCR